MTLGAGRISVTKEGNAELWFCCLLDWTTCCFETPWWWFGTPWCSCYVAVILFSSCWSAVSPMTVLWHQLKKPGIASQIGGSSPRLVPRAPSQYKTVFSGIRRPWDRFMFKMGTSILLRRHFYIETACILCNNRACNLAAIPWTTILISSHPVDFIWGKSLHYVWIILALTYRC